MPPQLSESIDKAIERDAPDTVIDLAWRAFYPELARFALRRGVRPTEVNDVVQDVFSRVLEGWSRFDRGDLRAWVFEICRYEVRTWLTRQRRLAAHDAAPDAPWNDPPKTRQPIEARSDMARVFEIIQNLCPLDRVVFDAMFVKGLSEQEAVAHIEALTGEKLSQGAIRVRKFRMRERVRQLMEATNA